MEKSVTCDQWHGMARLWARHGNAYAICWDLESCDAGTDP